MKELIERPWFNAIWFNLIWFAGVWGQQLAVPLIFALLALHLYAVGSRFSELKLWCFVGAIGLSIDGSLSYSGIFNFTDNQLIPLWLIGIWLGFASTLTRSLSMLRKYWLFGVPIGAIAGPMSYWAGNRMGAVNFGWPLLETLSLLAFIWSILLPILLLSTTFTWLKDVNKPCQEVTDVCR